MGERATLLHAEIISLIPIEELTETQYDKDKVWEKMKSGFADGEKYLMFSGDYKKSTNFRDLFTAVIHDRLGLTRTQKFPYSQSCLQGEASNIVSGLSIDDTSYDTAWTLLKDRYEDKRLQITSLLNRLFAIPDVTHDNLNKLKELRDTVRVVLESLKNLNCNIENWDPILNHCLLQKFNNHLRRDWKDKQSESKTYP